MLFEDLFVAMDMLALGTANCQTDIPKQLLQHAIIAHLDVEEVSIDLRIQLLQAGNRRDDAPFQDQNRFDQPGNATCAFQVTEVGFQSSTAKAKLASPPPYNA